MQPHSIDRHERDQIHQIRPRRDLRPEPRGAIPQPIRNGDRTGQAHLHADDPCIEAEDHLLRAGVDGETGRVGRLGLSGEEEPVRRGEIGVIPNRRRLARLQRRELV